MLFGVISQFYFCLRELWRAFLIFQDQFDTNKSESIRFARLSVDSIFVRCSQNDAERFTESIKCIFELIETQVQIKINGKDDVQLRCHSSQLNSQRQTWCYRKVGSKVNQKQRPWWVLVQDTAFLKPDLSYKW